MSKAKRSVPTPLDRKWETYRNRFATTGVDKLLERTIDVVKQVSLTAARPTIGNVVNCGLSVARALTLDGLYPHEVLAPTVWDSVFEESMYTQITSFLMPHVTSKVAVGADADDVTAYFIDTFEVSVAFVKSGNSTTEISVSKDKKQASLNWIREVVWSHFPDNHVVLSSSRSSRSNENKNYDSSDTGGIKLTRETITQPCHSQLAGEMAANLKRFIDAGHSRAMLIYGPPGTGKTSLVRNMCSILEMRSLRIRVEDMTMISNDAMINIVESFAPDVVVIDDMDRSVSPIQMLEMLDYLHRSVKCIFATVNDISSMTSALLRPGRFDELTELVSLDKQAIIDSLCEFTDSYEAVKDWPIAYINEYVVRRRILGKDAALASLQELQKRIDYVSKSSGTNVIGSSNDEEQW